MNRIIRKVLERLENEGFEAYIVGGYVRDLLLGKASFDIDICTNAIPKDLIKIFPNASTKNIGGIDFKIKEYHFEITTYREEIKYKNRKPVKFNYINNLMQDLKRRDFTINAILMNDKGEIIDLIKGIEDLRNLKIKMIGNTDIKLKEDPLRILRAVRFATILNFNLDSNLYKGILKHHKAVLKLSMTRIKEELDKIFLSNHVRKGLKLLDELGILNDLKISYDEVIAVKSLEAMYAQINIGLDLPFTKVEKENIKKIKQILNKGVITKNIVYKYGLYLSQVAGEILGINKNEVNKIYKSLPIKDIKEININSEDIVKTLETQYGKMISIVLKDLEEMILNNTIRNKRSEIIKYLKNNKSRWV